MSKTAEHDPRVDEVVSIAKRFAEGGMNAQKAVDKIMAAYGLSPAPEEPPAPQTEYEPEPGPPSPWAVRSRATRAYHEDRERYWLYHRVLPDSFPDNIRELWLLPMGGNLRISLGPKDDRVSFTTSWCFHDHNAAWEAALHWSGPKEPAGWIRHIETGRRQRFNAQGDIVDRWVCG